MAVTDASIHRRLIFSKENFLPACTEHLRKFKSRPMQAFGECKSVIDIQREVFFSMNAKTAEASALAVT